MNERFGRVPNHVGYGLLRIDAQEMLQNGQERNLLRRVNHLAQDGVKNIQMRTQIHPIRTLQLRFVTLPLFVEDVDLDGQIRVGDCLILQLVEGGQQLHANEFVADAQPILELRGRNDDAVDESHQCRLVFDCRSIAQFTYNNGETVTITFEVLEMFKSIERASVAIGVVDAEGREELEDLLFNGGVGRVEGRRQFSDILAVLDDVVESDARIHDAANRT